jgi:hypothetical protein
MTVFTWADVGVPAVAACVEFLHDGEPIVWSMAAGWV